MKIIMAFENPRLRLGAEQIDAVLCGGSEFVVADRAPGTDEIFITVRGRSEALQRLEDSQDILYHVKAPEGEAFQIEKSASGGVAVIGGSATGALYGCMRLCELIEKDDRVPPEALDYDEPAFRLRGPCVGLQKTTIEPPRRTYEYPITPERFPWFYDRALWTKFLDRLLEMRANVLYLWSGHPFSSLQKLEKYPEALEVTEEEYALNHETFLWLARECDRRGIWLVLKFYNIHIPLPFAEKHGLSLIQDSINPLVRDYSFEAIKRFVAEYPNVGLMVCLGEALRGADNKAAWFADTIVPAVKAGAALAGLKEEPPIILRGHDCDPDKALSRVQGGYKNLYTMWKYNGEGLTTRLPRGKWQKNHEKMNRLGISHIVNVHILADLEPFRFFSPLYIQQCVQAAKYRLGATSLHLYPLFYWDWPYSPDKTASERLLQMDRDDLWFRAWLRYAWNPDRDQTEEFAYWRDWIYPVYDCDRGWDAGRLLKAGELAALCQTKILARFGITEGNRQTLSLGMTMSQLTNAERYRPNWELYNSVARNGETLEEYARREAAGEAHTGETPPALVSALTQYVDRMDELLAPVDTDFEKCTRLLNDFKAIALFTRCMCEKVRAALWILKYKYAQDENCAGDLSFIENALAHLKTSLDYYRRLTELTDETYLFANSMQTRQRKIPFPDGGKYRHWRDCLPEYEKECAALEKNLDLMRAGVFPEPPKAGDAPKFAEAPFEVLSGGEKYTLCKGESVFTDRDASVELLASELSGLTGVRFSMGQAVVSGISLSLLLKRPSKILIGYVDDRGVEYLSPPSLETDTYADDRGGYAPRLIHAVKAKGLRAFNVHAFRYDAGRVDLNYPTGGFAVFGVIPAECDLPVRDAGLDKESLQNLDWLYDPEALKTD